MSPWTEACPASLSLAILWSLPKFMTICISNAILHCISDAIQQSHPVTLFSFCLQSFPGSGSFPKSQLFALGVQNTGASASVLPMSIHGWFPLRLIGLISLAVQGILKSLLQHNSLKASVLQHSSFLVQLSQCSHDYWKDHGLYYTELCQQSVVYNIQTLTIGKHFKDCLTYLFFQIKIWIELAQNIADQLSPSNCILFYTSQYCTIIIFDNFKKILS